MTEQRITWRPLFALADLAGERWEKRARQAALVFSRDQEDESTAILLLQDLRDLFKKRETDHLFSDEIVEHLIKLEDRPWPEWGRSRKPITKNALAGLLRPFKVKPENIRIGPEHKKGYLLMKHLKGVFKRYVPETPPDQSGTTGQASNDAGFSEYTNGTNTESVPFRDRRKASNDAGCPVVPDQKMGAQQGNGPDPELLRILTDACAGLSVTSADLLAKLDPEDYAAVIADIRQARQLAERLAERPGA